jgi:predicted RNA-binding Zn-ribbon protein involved in translation (DUF1610 family)
MSEENFCPFSGWLTETRGDYQAACKVLCDHWHLPAFYFPSDTEKPPKAICTQCRWRVAASEVQSCTHEWTIYMNGTMLRCPKCGALQETE